MRLYIQQKVFSWRDRFTVWDEWGAERYHVVGELFTWGKVLHVNDASGAECAVIQQKVWSFLPRYFVYQNGKMVAEIVKEMTFFRPRYRIEGLNWRVEGSVWEHDYSIMDGSEPIVTIHKKWMTWGDCYELDIRSEQHELIALIVTLAVDCVMASRN